MKRWIVRLEAEERQPLEQLVRVGKAAGDKIRHARGRVAVDESEQGPGCKDEEASRTPGLTVRAIERPRRRFVEKGLEAGLVHIDLRLHNRTVQGLSSAA